MKSETIVKRLTAPQRRLLVTCVRHDARERRRLEENPKRIWRSHFAYGAAKRTARSLLAAGLLGDNCCFAGAGADIISSDLGRAVATQCPEWDIIPIGKAS